MLLLLLSRLCVRSKTESGYVEVQSVTAACRLPRSTHRLTLQHREEED